MGLNDRKLEHSLQLRIVKLLNVFVMALPFAVCWFVYYGQKIDMPFDDIGNWLILFLFVVLYFTYGRIYDAFLVSLNRITEMIYSQALAVIVSDGVMYVISCLVARRLLNVLPLMLVFGLQLLFSVVWSLLAHHWYFSCFDPRRSIIVYDRNRGIKDLIDEYGLNKKFDVQKRLTIDECLKDLSQLDSAQNVFLAGVHSKERNIVLKYCVEKDIRMYIIPRIGDVIMSGAKKMHMFHLPMLRVGRYDPTPEYLFAKRAFDIIMSGLAIIITSPVMLITAIAIKAYDGGPVFYKQERLTKDGKVFKLIKFRSMRVDAEKDGIARLSTGENDDRITSVGRVIRKLRIDELPQLFNIIKGDLSIVGPRPERPSIAEQYEQEMPDFKLRLQCKAGLTGYAQVHGKYNTTPYDKLMMDLMYIANPGFLQDLRIIIATIKILFLPESTEGIKEGQVTAMETESKAETAEEPVYEEERKSTVA